MSSEIDIASYTSSNKYTAPADGYVSVVNTGSDKGFALINGASGSTQSFSIGYALGRFSLYVKKGTIISVGDSPTAARFYPLS